MSHPVGKGNFRNPLDAGVSFCQTSGTEPMPGAPLVPFACKNSIFTGKRRGFEALQRHNPTLCQPPTALGQLRKPEKQTCR
jgi:hypothetical protein